MLKIILIAVAVIVVVLAVIVVLQPSEFRVARSATISAPASTVFAQVNDFHKWQAWNPWGKIDPAMKQTYEGAPAGTGAIYTWAGNNEVGEGRMTIIESRPSELIRVKLEFFKPFAATNTAEFTFKPEAQSNGGHVEHVRRQKFHGQGNPSFHKHGQNDRWPIREGTRQNEIGGGSVGQAITRRPSLAQRRKETWPQVRTPQRLCRIGRSCATNGCAPIIPLRRFACAGAPRQARNAREFAREIS